MQKNKMSTNKNSILSSGGGKKSRKLSDSMLWGYRRMNKIIAEENDELDEGRTPKQGSQNERLLQIPSHSKEVRKVSAPCSPWRLLENKDVKDAKAPCSSKVEVFKDKDMKIKVTQELPYERGKFTFLPKKNRKKSEASVTYLTEGQDEFVEREYEFPSKAFTYPEIMSYIHNINMRRNAIQEDKDTQEKIILLMKHKLFKEIVGF